MPNDQGHKINVALQSDKNLSELSATAGAARTNLGAQAESGLTQNNAALFHDGGRGAFRIPEVVHSSSNVAVNNESSSYANLFNPGITLPANFWVLGRELNFEWKARRVNSTNSFRQVTIGGAALFSQQIYTGSADHTEQGRVWIKCVDDWASPGTLRLVYAYDWMLTNPNVLSVGQITGSTLSDEGASSVLDPSPSAVLALLGKLTSVPSGTQSTRLYSRILTATGG